MALLFLDGMDKYGPANTNSTVVSGLLAAGEWTQVGASANLQIVAPLSSTGQAVQSTVGGTANFTKTLPGAYARLIGGVRIRSDLSSATNAGILFMDGVSVQCSLTINQTSGLISLRNGVIGSATILATSSTAVAANSVHYLEWDISFGNAAAYQVWLDGVSLFSGTGDTTTTANNTANIFGFGTTSSGGGPTVAYDDLYLFDTSGTINNAVLLTSPRIETQFPSGDGAVQFAAGAAIIGSSISRAAVVSTAINQLRLRPITPYVNCTIASVSLLPAATNASVQLRPVIYGDTAGAPGTLLSAGSTASGITANVNKTLPLTTPQALTAGTLYWIGFMCDIAVGSGLSGLDGSATDRTATSTFASGAPGTAPATAATTATVIWGNVTTAAGNWYATGQNPPQGSSSYVFDATVGHEDLYTFPALTALAPTIYAVAVKANVAKSDAGAKTVSMRTKSGATDSGGSAGALAPGTSYAWLTSLFPTDPNTSAAWTLAALNAAQAGVKVES